MKNKGFTLIELLGVITLISLIVLIIIPAASKTVKKGSDVAQKQTIESIILSAKNWASDHKEELPKEAEATYGVKVIDLQKGGYIDKDIDIPLNITNDASETEKNEAKNKACVQITNIKKDDSNKDIYNYTYESECNNNKPCQILLNDVKAPAKAKWFNTPVTVTVKNANGEPGFISTDPNTDYDAISTNGKTSESVNDTESDFVIYYGYVKTPSGQSESCSATFGIDRVAPTCNIYGVSENSEATIQPQDNTITTNGNIKLKGVCEDKGSGCVNEKLTLTPNEITTTKAQETFNVEVKDWEGKNQICDNIGNCTPCPSVKVNIDKDTPECTITATTNPNGNGWYKGDVKLVLKMSENGNDITLDSTTADKYGIVTQKGDVPGTNSIDKTVSSSGIYYGYIYKDGNEIICQSKKINIDKEAPTCTVGTYKKNSDGVFNTKVTDWVNVNVKVKGVCKDTGGSKCVTNQDNLTNTPVKTDKYTKNTNTSVSPGKVCDNAGNCTDCGKSAVKVDITDPTCAITISGKKCGKLNAGNYYYKTPSMTQKDTGGSGVDSHSMSWKAYYKTDCSSLSSPRTGSGSSKFYCGDFNRKVVINGKVSDNAGNTGSCSKTFYTNYPGTC